jgi:hypothetical protein
MGDDGTGHQRGLGTGLRVERLEHAEGGVAFVFMFLGGAGGVLAQRAEVNFSPEIPCNAWLPPRSYPKRTGSSGRIWRRVKR